MEIHEGVMVHAAYFDFTGWRSMMWWAVAFHEVGQRLLDINEHEPTTTAYEGATSAATNDTFMTASQHPKIWQ